VAIVFCGRKGLPMFPKPAIRKRNSEMGLPRTSEHRPEFSSGQSARFEQCVFETRILFIYENFMKFRPKKPVRHRRLLSAFGTWAMLKCTT